MSERASPVEFPPTARSRDAVSRADLARLLFGGGFERKTAAGLCGFALLEPEGEKANVLAAQGLPPLTPKNAGRELNTQPETDVRLPMLWRAIGPRVEVDLEPPPASLALAEPLARLGARADFVPPQPAPLAPASRLASALRRLLVVATPSGRLDALLLIASLARCRTLRRLPRKPRACFSPRLSVYWDRATVLQPAAADQRAALEWLCRVRGPRGLELGLVEGSGRVRWYRARSGRRLFFDEVLRPSAPLDPSSSVLALSDLGFAGSDAGRVAFWNDLAVCAARLGASTRALVLCPAARWTSAAAPWRPLEWERSRARHSSANLERAQRVDRLLALLAPAVRIEPALLRAARRLLGAGAGLGTEFDAWMDPRIAGRSPLAATFDRAAVPALRARFAALPRSLRLAVHELLKAQHEGLSPLVLAEEQLAFPDPEIRAQGRRTFAAYATKIEPGVRDAGQRSYHDRLEARREPADWEIEELRATWALANRHADHSGFERPLPEGLDFADVAWALNGTRPVSYCRLLQHGNVIAFSHAARREDPLPAGMGCLLAELPYRNQIHVEWIDEAGKRSTRLIGPHIGGIVVRLGGEPGVDRVRLSSDLGALELRLEARPEWADTLERDARGLWLAVELPKPVSGSSTATRSLSTVPGSAIDRVLWPTWATRVAYDSFGLVAELALDEEVTMRLRWVPAGRFLMGSPEDEEGRYEDEGPQHWVTLTEGYWLGEAPCTQREWRALMGSEPSEFKGESRPVERVSWEECAAFCQRLEARFPGFGARLPTEAEWEYACRAGTLSAYNDGSGCTVPQGKDPALERLGWFEETSGNTTHPVRGLKPNAWGLYDMHGNVWEWCADWRGAYSEEEQVDPRGPEQPEAARERVPRGPEQPEAARVRVLRGGSWLLWARGCRSAFRLSWHPGLRSSILGFRLAGGQRGVSSGQEGAEPRAGGAEPHEAAVKQAGRSPAASGGAGRRPSKKSVKKGGGR